MAAHCKMTNAVCESSNKSWVVIEQCRLRAVSRNMTTLNIIANFLQPAHNIQLLLQLKKKANGYKPWLFDYSIDACAFMRKQRHPVYKLFWLIIRDFSTINHSCPYEVSEAGEWAELTSISQYQHLQGRQVLKDFYYDPSNLTLPVPSGDYLLLLTWLFDNRKQFVTNVYFNFHQDVFLE